MTTHPPTPTSLSHNDPTGQVLLLRLEESMAKKCQSATSAISFNSFRVQNLEEARKLSDSSIPTCLIVPNHKECLRTLQNPSDRVFRRTVTVIVESEETLEEPPLRASQFAFSHSATQETLQAEITAAIGLATELQWKWSTIENFQRRLERLTPEEFVVLDAVCLGNLNKQIAKKLGVSIRTIEQRRRRVFDKMGVESAVTLAAQLATVKALTFPLHRRDAPHPEVASPTSPVIHLTSALSHPAHASNRRIH